MSTPESNNRPDGKNGESSSEPIFRREAIDFRNRSGHESHLLRLLPTWVRRTYWLLALVCSFALVYVVCAKVNEYAVGTAVLHADGQTDVSAHIAGSIASLHVLPGARVAEGQVLIGYHDAQERAELTRIEQELELLLVEMLRNPEDQAARRAVASLRAQRELAQTRVKERSIRAPSAGVVRDIRVRIGQTLQAGDYVLSLGQEAQTFRVTAVLPGHYRPLIKPGMAMRLELHGFPWAARTITVDTVAAEVIGPAEAKRYLRQSNADIVTVDGPVVLVEARIEGRSFTADGRTLDYHPGMLASAEVRVRSETILETLIPALRR